MPRNVSLTMAVAADEPLLIKPVGMPGNALQVYRFIGSRLLCHRLTALFASFCRHCFPSRTIYMKYDGGSTTLSTSIFNFGNCCRPKSVAENTALKELTPLFHKGAQFACLDSFSPRTHSPFAPLSSRCVRSNKTFPSVSPLLAISVAKLARQPLAVANRAMTDIMDVFGTLIQPGLFFAIKSTVAVI
jgi:hypothetical protein